MWNCRGVSDELCNYLLQVAQNGYVEAAKFCSCYWHIWKPAKIACWSRRKGCRIPKTQDFYSGPRSQNGLPKIEVPRVPQNHWFLRVITIVYNCIICKSYIFAVPPFLETIIYVYNYLWLFFLYAWILSHLWLPEGWALCCNLHPWMVGVLCQTCDMSMEINWSSAGLLGCLK